MADLVTAEPLLLRPDQAPQRYLEAVQTAVAACAADTAGQTCYICYGEGDEEEGLVRMCACRGAAGFVHISCLARQAEVSVERVQTFERWYSCGLCEQQYHGIVYCALAWACWKTYVGLPEEDNRRRFAIFLLGSGLHDAELYTDALTVKEAQLSEERRLGADEDDILVSLSNLACSCQKGGRLEEALRIHQDVYFGSLNLHGEEHRATLGQAIYYASSLSELQRHAEAKALLRKTIPVARRVLGESQHLTLRMRFFYADALYLDDDATLDDLREAVTTLEDMERTARRVFGGSHPLTEDLEAALRNARAALGARETPPPASPAPLYDEDELD